MVKGIAVRMNSYEETIPKVLKLIKLDKELKKHDKIVVKPNLIPEFPDLSSKPEFIEQILKYCIQHKNPGSEVFIAEGCDGANTNEVFDEFGFTNIAEKYGVGLVDLNNADTEEVGSTEFLKFETIHYPKLLLDGFIISAPKLSNNNNLVLSGSLSSMLGAFPAKHYKGFFSSTKNKLSKYPIKYQIHDILKCKLPELAIIDSIDKGFLIVGQPLEMDKQSSKVLGLNWKNIPYLSLIEESTSLQKDNKIDNLIN